MSAAAHISRSAGQRTRAAAVLVLIGLATLAAYAMFSGPTTVPLPGRSQGGPAKTAPPAHGEEPPGEGGGD